MPSANGYFKNRKPVNKSDLIEYNFETAERLQVPGDWNSQQEKLFLYEGTIWYKRDFDYQLPAGKRLFVYFGAANYEAQVYLNGEHLGSHTGGFTPFNFEITPFVRDSNNFLIVKVDNRRRREGVPTVNTDWWNYGGLTRDVMLVETPAVFIRDYFMQLAKGSTSRISGWVQLDGGGTGEAITVRIPETGAEKTVRADASGFAAMEFDVNVQLWSPENPKLYRVEILSETDSVTDHIGFRTLEVRGDDILLNGEPVFLRGISIHEQAPLRDGRANKPEDARILLNWVKELQGNFVRLAHYPHNEHMVRLADETGLLVWAEIPVYWTILWDHPGTLQNATRQLTEMIIRDKNRAAVILWSVSNETPLSDARLKFLVRLANRARELDATRLITAALERHYLDEHTLMIDDPFGKYLDVIGVNEYIGWYDGLPEKAQGLQWQTIYDKPLIISEFGGGAFQGLHGDSLSRWTEEYQASVYRNQLKMLARIPFLRGMSPWILTDFRSPRRPLPEIQDFWNRKGLISNHGIKKQAFYILRDYYRDLIEMWDK